MEWAIYAKLPQDANDADQWYNSNQHNPAEDEFFRNVPDAMRKVPTFQEALEASERRGAVHNQQQTLILILRHRFGEVPDPVVQLIEATDDLAQLAKWLEQALDVNSLGAMGFISN